MASNTPVDTSIVVDYSVFGEELPTLSPHAQDVYGCLLNNGIYAFQPNCKMDVKIIETVLGCYYGTVRFVYLQSPQVAYVDICLGNELISPGFHRFFLSGIHRASFPDTPQLDCNVVFNPLEKMIRPDQLYNFAMAIAENKELSRMNIQYFHSNPNWNPNCRPKLLDLPSGADLDDIEQQL